MKKTILFTLLLCLGIVSCVTSKKATKEKDTTQAMSERVERLHDTLRVTDSIYIKESSSIRSMGDTVLVENKIIEYRYRDRYRNLCDTVTKTDTIIKVKEVRVDAEKKSSVANLEFKGFILLAVFVSFVIFTYYGKDRLF